MSGGGGAPGESTANTIITSSVYPSTGILRTLLSLYMYLRSLQHGSGVRSDGCRHGMEEQASWSALYSAHTLPQISKLELAVILQCARLLPVATMVFLYSALPHSRSTDTLAIAEYEDRNPPFHAYPPVLHNQGARGCRRLGREEFRCRAGKRPIREPSLTGMSV
jgi:hypothetical protein